MRRIAILILILAVPSSAGVAQVQDGTRAAPTIAVHLGRVNLTALEADRVSFRATVDLTPERSLTLLSLHFSAMKVNGVPVYVRPIGEKFTLRAGEPSPLPDLQLTIFFRDLSSTAPLQALLEQEKVDLSGQIAAGLQASLLEQLALHSLHPTVSMPFHERVPVTLPGGELGRQAALATLNAYSQLHPAVGSLLPGGDAAWRQDLEEHQIGHLLLVQTRYTVVFGGNRSSVQSAQLGFWIGPGMAVVTEEALRPWEFDAGLLQRLAAEKGHIEETNTTVSVQPVSAVDSGAHAPAWTLAAGDFRVETAGQPTRQRVVVSAKGTAVQVAQRGSQGNYALLRFREGIAGSPLETGNADAASALSTAVFRLVENPSGSTPQVEAVMLPASSDGRQITTGDPIDSSAFGSPVLTREGAVGLLQDESYATPLSSLPQIRSSAK